MCIYSPMPNALSYCALIGKCALIRSNTVKLNHLLILWMSKCHNSSPVVYYFYFNLSVLLFYLFLLVLLNFFRLSFLSRLVRYYINGMLPHFFTSSKINNFTDLLISLIIYTHIRIHCKNSEKVFQLHVSFSLK